MDKTEREYLQQALQTAKNLLCVIENLSYYDEAKETIYIENRQQFKLVRNTEQEKIQ